MLAAVKVKVGVVVLVTFPGISAMVVVSGTVWTCSSEIAVTVLSAKLFA